MILDPILDMFRGKAVTIPPLDGAFRPNTRLDEAPAFAALTEPEICWFPVTGCSLPAATQSIRLPPEPSPR